MGEILHVFKQVTCFRLWRRAEGLLHAKIFIIPSDWFIIIYSQIIFKLYCASNYMTGNKEWVNCCYSTSFNNPKRDNHLFFQLSNNPDCSVCVGDCYKCIEINRCGYLPISSAAKLLPCTCDMRVSCQHPGSCLGKVLGFGSSWSCSCLGLSCICFNLVFINWLHTVLSWWSMGLVSHCCDFLNSLIISLNIQCDFWVRTTHLAKTKQNWSQNKLNNNVPKTWLKLQDKQ